MRSEAATEILWVCVGPYRFLRLGIGYNIEGRPEERPVFDTADNLLWLWAVVGPSAGRIERISDNNNIVPRSRPITVGHVL